MSVKKEKETSSEEIQPELVEEPVKEAEPESEEEAKTEEAPSVETLARQVAEAQEKAAENWDKLLRVKAEMDNLRRRTEKDLQSAHKYALEKFSKELLPVVDSLELGLQSLKGDDEAIQELRKGVELTLKQLQTAFEKFNIKSVNPTGEPFNPEHHQAMSMLPSEEHEPNSVMTVFQKGYLLNERLLRPAMVIVSQPAPGDSKKIDEQA